jgi:hypothetical protein
VDGQNETDRRRVLKGELEKKWDQTRSSDSIKLAVEHQFQRRSGADYFLLCYNYEYVITSGVLITREGGTHE